MKRIKISKKKKYLFFLLIYILGLTIFIISLIDTIDQKENPKRNFDIFIRSLSILFFTGCVIEYGLKYRKESRES